jgi:hypothetical protein
MTYTSAPTRSAVNDANQTADMLALGLQSHIVGTWAVAADGPVVTKSLRMLTVVIRLWHTPSGSTPPKQFGLPADGS